MSDFGKLIKRIVDFRDAREWRQFHTPKDMALSLILEAGELAEHFQWRDLDQCREHITQNREALGDELADVLYWVLLLSHDLEIDLSAAFERKMIKNENKYPIDEFRGSNRKYDTPAR